MNYPLRGDKLFNFLKFKYLVEVTSKKLHLGANKNIFLSLIVIASQLDSRSKPGTKIKYLNPEQAKYVLNNIIPEGVDISSLTNSLAEVKANSLTLDFVFGVFETNTNNYKKLSIEDQNYIRDKFLPKGVKI
jgi:hypothetical protein